MVGLFGTLGTANKGLNAQQKALETTGHNIANANTAGYSRQRVNMKADHPYHMIGTGEIGTGVTVTSINRIVDDFVIKNIRTENSTYQYYSQKAEILGELEVIFNETPFHKGVSDNLAIYFDSWAKLGNNPEMDNAKSIVLENGNILTDSINHMAQQIDDLQENSMSILEKSVLDINGKLKQLDTINKQIYKISNDGSIPNDLLDQRDALLEELSTFTKIDTSFDQYGRTYVSIDGKEVLTNNKLKVISLVMANDKDGKALVSNGGDALQARELIDKKIQVGTILLSDSDAKKNEYESLSMASGSSKGLQQSIEEILVRKKELNNFAFTLGQSVNLIHSNEGEGIDFFEMGNNGNIALNLKISKEIKENPMKINTSESLGKHEVGDGGRAVAISKLKSTKLGYPTTKERLLADFNKETMSFSENSEGLSFLGSFVDIVTKNGISKQQADNTVKSQEYLLSQLQLRKDSISGVNLNEEVSDVIRFQRAFQANSRVISVISEMLDTLINRTGV